MRDAAVGAASAPEAEAVDLVPPWAHRWRLPLLVNPTLRVDGLLLGRPDLYLPTLALGLEVDSRRHHGAVGDLDETLRRHRRFADAGVRLLHTTPIRLRSQPRDVLSDLAAAAGRAWQVPEGLLVEPHSARSREAATTSWAR